MVCICIALYLVLRIPKRFTLGVGDINDIYDRKYDINLTNDREFDYTALSP